METDLARHWRNDLRLRVALGVTVLFHGGLLASGSHKRTYDAFVHLFFADHYYRDWFSSWEPRWYTGFPVVSYPPGVHQLLAALKGPLGTDGAYVTVQLAALLLLVIGVYRFSAVWVGHRAAGWAALGAVASSSLAEVVHVFGQLPTTLAMALLLNAQPSIDRWLRVGQKRDLVTALAFLAGTTAVHHVTTLFGSVFFVGPIVARVLLDRFATPQPHEPQGRVSSITPRVLVPVIARRTRRFLPELKRTIVLGIAVITTLATVILPYWLWSSRDPIVQVSIPHGSRENFLTNLDAGLVFWAMPWASVLLLMPAALLRGATKNVWPLAASTALLFVLGTGGTTPIPRLLLRGAFDILTLDRFTIWASIMILPLAAPIVEWMIDETRNIDLREAFGRFAPQVCVATLTLIALASSLFAASLASFRPMQPDLVEAQPIVSFLEKDSHDQWRYLMLGFGDQMAAISAQTTARTVDGNYHSARRLPELTSRSVERLEGAKFRGVDGLGSLQQFVGNPEKYNLKFIFSNDAFYDPLLWSYGWNRLGELDNNVIVWERADISPLPLVETRNEIPGWQRAMWGILPPVALVAAAAAFVRILFGTNPALSAPKVTRRGPVDRWLLRQTEVLRTVPRDGTRRPLLRWDPASLLPHPRRQLRIAAAVCVLGVAGAGFMVLNQAEATPEDAITSYYDRLDFQEYDKAWQALNPADRAPLAEYLKDRSLRDGLFDGYAELDSVEVLNVTTTNGTAQADVRLTYLTSVESFIVERSHGLVEVDGEWRIDADPLPVRRTVAGIAAEQVTQFSATTVVASSDRKSRAADRPHLVVGEVTARQRDGRWSAIGHVTNIDAVPAQITVDAELRDTDGASIASATATATTTHVLLPGESTGFRVDFDTPSDGDFDPTQAGTADFDFGLDLEDVSDVVVAVRAVPTAERTRRDLAFDEVAIDESGRLTATVSNTGMSMITVPKILATAYGPDGAVVWVETVFVPTALAPGERHPVTLQLSPNDADGRTVASSQPSSTAAATGFFTVGGVDGVAAVSLTGAGFDRVGEP